MADHAAEPFPIEGVTTPFWMLRFDAEGNCESEETRRKLLETLGTESPSDVFVLAHGWNNAFDHAVGWYGTFLKELEKLPGGPPRANYRPIAVGITWPSMWFVGDDGPTFAGAESLLPPLQKEIATRAAATGGNGVKAERVRVLLEQPRLDRAEARELAEAMLPLLDPRGGNEVGPTDADLDANAVLTAVADIERATSGAPPKDPNDWGEGTTNAPAGPQAAGFLDYLDPRNFVRLFSTYQMKDRAGTVGWNGIGPLLRDIVSSSGAAHVHVVGHSYGCKVVLSAICRTEDFARPLASVLLLQPAVSHLAFASAVPGRPGPGGYVLALKSDRVRPPILSTYSARDFPLHGAFHLGMRRAEDLGEATIASSTATTAGDPPSRYAALGGYGPRGCDERLRDPMPGPGQPYEFPDTPIMGVDGSNGQIGGHGDIANANTAWALHQLAFNRP